MPYDRHGFPIPKEFEPPAGGARRREAAAVPEPSRSSFEPATDAASVRPATAGRLKKSVLLALLALGVVPAIAAPVLLPVVRDAVVQWSVDGAMMHEGRGNVAAAARHVGRAIDWADADAAGPRCELLCWRADLRLKAGDAAGAIADADQAVTIAPTAAQSHRIRALAHVVAGNPEAALADATAVVRLEGDGHPDALNHRAYIRALVGLELPAALEDIEAALAGSGAGSAEFLDTRGFILHLLGRHQEAIDDLNRAIDKARQARQELMMLSGRVDSDALAYRLRPLDHGLAVMHHHRGLACQAAGLERQARQDFEVAKRKGFAPDRGVL